MNTPRPIHDMESKWQNIWEEQNTYHADTGKNGEKFFGLVEFPFPSGDGLHVGHTRSYFALDAYTRRQRMLGKNVMFPMGWDAFGLPTENYAIKNKVKPQDATKKNVGNFKRQMKSMGFGFDWDREIDTTDPKYYKWTQWQFKRFFESFYDRKQKRARPIDELAIPQEIIEQGDKAIRQFIDGHRMAFKGSSTINWCEKCKIGLANEEAVGGVCERCGAPVIEKEKSQWMIRITEYADRLLEDLNKVDYLDRVKAQQKNWIGKSEGARIHFRTSTDDKITVFTTRPDTIFGVTYVTLAPEHELVSSWLKNGFIKNTDEVKAYITTASAKSVEERQAEQQTKTGVKLEGVTATNPVNGESVPVFISDYVLAGYGTGAVMAVPAHDERDYAFAMTFKLPVKQVLAVEGIQIELPYVQDGIAINSDFINDLPTWKAKEDVTSWLTEFGKGEYAATYRLRDWVFSRQRYWGEPIPVVDCVNCGHVAVPDEQLPVVLPDVDAYEPTEDGSSPLAKIDAWVNVSCPSCGGKAKRETDVMPNWAGSSWYFLRYCDPHNDEQFASPEALKYWMPVNLYNGGMEHTTLHLLYSRFWHKFLWDLGHIPKEVGPEPYAKRRSHGLVMAEGGEKMSKSKGNVVNPDDVIRDYGADVFKVYELFMGPFDQPVPWDTNGIEGVKRFIDKVWQLFTSEKQVEKADAKLETLYHQTVKKIGEGIDELQFNTCISSLMILVNAFQDHGGIPSEMKKGFIGIIAPFMPHLAEELWLMQGETTSVHHSVWPSYDSTKLVADTFELVVQVNGKVRAKLQAPSSITEEEAIKFALEAEGIATWLNGKTPSQMRYVKGRLVSIVV